MSFNEFNIQFFAVRLGPVSTTDSDFNFTHVATPPLLGVPSTLRKIGLGSGAIGETESPELEA